MGKTAANLYLEYIEYSNDNPRVLTIISDDIIVEDGSASIFKTKVKYVLKLKLIGQEANISVKFDDINPKNPLSIRKSSNVEVIFCGRATN